MSSPGQFTTVSAESAAPEALAERLERVTEEREQDLREQGHALLALESELATAQNLIAQLQATEEEIKQWTSRRIAEADEELARRAREGEARAAELGRTIAELEGTVVALEGTIAHLASRLAQAERTIDDMDRSLSWRMTRPLRGFKRMLAGR